MAKQITDSKILRRANRFAKKMKAERIQQDMSQVKLAKKANVSVDTIRAIEGRFLKIPGLITAYDIMKALGKEKELAEWIK